MKKIIGIVITILMVLALLAGCSANNKQASPSASAAASGGATAGAASSGGASAGNTAGNAAKTGLAVITSLAKSKDVSTEDGLAQVDSTVVAVTVDKDGKIVKCKIDQTQTKVNFNGKGKLTTPLDTAYLTKQELGTNYGMRQASSIQKEWYEEANALADYVIGKTAEEVKGIALSETGAPADAELASSVTISIGSFLDTIEKAIANAKDLGATTADTLGLGISTSIAKSADAAAEEGVAQAASGYVAATFGADGKITSCIVEGSNSDVNFNATGKITTDINAAPKTKTEIGAGYGMIKASSIKKEWFEEAEALAKYVTGKTVDEVKGISLNEKGAPAAAELASSVTISIAGYIGLIEKCAANAK